MNARRMLGFSMIEVLASLVIISVGLLGIAKIQVLAYSETNTASLRSIAAMEAASMASSMRANRAYWSTGASLNPNPLTFNILGTAVTSTDPAMPANPDCEVTGTPPCSITTMASYDVQRWANALTSVLGPTAAATIDCPTIVTPINCTIAVTWTERIMAGGQANTSPLIGAAVITPTYTLYVQP